MNVASAKPSHLQLWCGVNLSCCVCLSPPASDCAQQHGGRRGGGPLGAAGAEDRGQAVRQRTLPGSAAQAGQHWGRHSLAGEGEKAQVRFSVDREFKILVISLVFCWCSACWLVWLAGCRFLPVCLLVWLAAGFCLSVCLAAGFCCRCLSVGLAGWLEVSACQSAGCGCLLVWMAGCRCRFLPVGLAGCRFLPVCLLPVWLAGWLQVSACLSVGLAGCRFLPVCLSGWLVSACLSVDPAVLALVISKKSCFFGVGFVHLQQEVRWISSPPPPLPPPPI